MSAQQGDDFLDWTCTPEMMVLKDGHARCFVATAAQPPKEDRRHSLHLDREIEIQPSALEKKAADRKSRVRVEPLEIRVREEDLRECGDNIEELVQCALGTKNLPPMKHWWQKCGGGKKKPNLSSYGRGGRKVHRGRDTNLARNVSTLATLLEQGPLNAAWMLSKDRHSASVPALGNSCCEDLRPGTAPTASIPPRKEAWGSDNLWSQTQTRQVMVRNHASSLSVPKPCPLITELTND